MRRKFIVERHTAGRLHAIGDIHGMLSVLNLNLSHEGLARNGKWTGENDTLVCTGDLTDRGPKGYEVVRRLCDLSSQAANVGGKVVVCMGNHDVSEFGVAKFIADRPKLYKALHDSVRGQPLFDRGMAHRAYTYTHKPEEKHIKYDSLTNKLWDAVQSVVNRYVNETPDDAEETTHFVDLLHGMVWRNGLHLEDVLKLSEDSKVLKWGLNLPFMYYQDGVLFQHCNGVTAYKSLLGIGQRHKLSGDNIEKVNEIGKQMMNNGRFQNITTLFNVLTDEGSRDLIDSVGGESQVDGHLKTFAPDATKMAHGHSSVHHRNPGATHKPFQYVNGKVVSLDVDIVKAANKFDSPDRMFDLTDHADKHRAKPSTKRKSTPLPPPTKTPTKTSTKTPVVTKKTADDLGLPKPRTKDWEYWVASRAYYIYNHKYSNNHDDTWDTHKMWFKAEKDITDYVSHLDSTGSTHDSLWWQKRSMTEWRRQMIECVREAFAEARMLHEARSAG